MWASVNFAATTKLEKMREQSLFLTSTINCELIPELYGPFGLREREGE